MSRKKSKSRKREREGEREDVEVKESDVQLTMQLLLSLQESFALQAGFILPQLKQLNCDLKPAWYYPDNGDTIYLGFALKLPNEECAKYFAKALELATEKIKRLQRKAHK